MNILNQPGLKNFITYVFSFIFITLFIYLGIPFFFDYKNSKIDIERKLLRTFDLHLKLTNKPKYNIFPSPRLNLKNVEILDFSNGSKKIGIAEKIILKIPFKNLINLDKMDFLSAELVDSIFNIKVSEIGNFINYLNTTHKNPIKIKRSKINILDKTNLLLSANLKKLEITGRDFYSKVNYKGKIFNTKIKIDYQNQNFEQKPKSNIVIAFPEIGLNIKSIINLEEKNINSYYGKTSIFFPNNQFCYMKNKEIFDNVRYLKFNKKK